MIVLKNYGSDLFFQVTYSKAFFFDEIHISNYADIDIFETVFLQRNVTGDSILFEIIRQVL